MVLKINVSFNIKDSVYVVTDPDQEEGKVVYIMVSPGGEILYGVSKNGTTMDFYDFELSADKRVI